MDTQGERYAIVIGIEDYEDKSIDPVRFAEQDAKDFYRMITEAKEGGYERKNVELILSREATHGRIAKAIREMFEKVYATDSLLLYYTGHGEYTSFGGYLIPSDFRKGEEITAKGYSLTLINNFCRQRRPKNFLFLFDCCHSGWAVDEIRLGCDRSDRDMRVRMQEQTLEFTQEGKGRVIMTSCRADEISKGFDDLGHGVFSYYLLEGLKGGADYDADGRVDVDDVYRYVCEKVVEYGLRKRFQQSPIKKGVIDGRFYLPSWGAGNKRTSDGPILLNERATFRCPICGRWNEERDTFHCKGCDRNYLCLVHQVKGSWVCEECDEKNRSEPTIKETSCDLFTPDELQELIESIGELSEGAVKKSENKAYYFDDWIMLSKAWIMLRNNEKAARALTKAEARSEFVREWTRLAVGWKRLEDNHRASKAFQKAEASAEKAIDFTAIGEAWMALGNRQKAIQWIEKAESLADDSSGWSYLAEVWNSGGNKIYSTRALEKAEAMVKLILDRIDVARVWRRVGDRDRAIRNLKRAEGSNPSVILWVSIIQEWTRLGLREQATQAINKAENAATNEKDAYSWLVVHDCWRRMGIESQAVTAS